MSAIKIRVLVVDDQDAVRDAVTELLEESGAFEVIGQACDGTEAVEAIAEPGSVVADAVLMDLRMPVMDGVEATRRIVEAGCTVPVLIHSAYGDDSLVLEAFQAGARGYVVKGSSDVVSALKTVVDGNSHVSDEITGPLVSKLVQTLGRERQTRMQAEAANHLMARTALQQKEFAMQAAHELRTPLTAILGSLEMLEDVDGLSPDAIATLARGALDGVRRLARLTENLEVIASAELLAVRAEPTSLDAAVADVVSGIEGGCVVEARTTGMVVSADPVRLRQVLNNVIRNAVAASSEHGPVSVSARVVDGSVVVEVADRGPGFDPSVLERLYDPFEHKIGSACGLGVGLAVARQLMEHMGGTIKAADRTDGGAVVRLTFRGVFA